MRIFKELSDVLNRLVPRNSVETLHQVRRHIERIPVREFPDFLRALERGGHVKRSGSVGLSAIEATVNNQVSASNDA